MNEIPDDIQKAASTVCFLLGRPDRQEVDTTIVARALLAERQSNAARIAALEAECFGLAAGSCQFGLVGDEHGNFSCAGVKAARDRIAALEALRKEAAEALSDTLSLAVFKWGNLDKDANTVFANARTVAEKLKGARDE